MTITVHPLIYYRSKSEDWTDGWQQNDWIALNIVRAIKHKEFNGSSRIPLKSGGAVVIDSSKDGRRRALSLMAKTLAKRIKKAGYDDVLVVPIPSSGHTILGHSFTGSRISSAIQAQNASLISSPSLYFSEAIPKSSEGGGRDAAFIQSKLRGGDDIPAGSKVILLDDVFTTGAHMKAVTRYLRQRDIDVKDGFVVARTRWDRPEHMLKAEPEDLPFT